MADLLVKTAASVLRLPCEQVSNDTAMGQCPSWDSLNHFNLILAVEQAFGVRFSSAVIPDLTSIRALREELARISS
jgi:acyl carrier protein